MLARAGTSTQPLTADPRCHMTENRSQVEVWRICVHRCIQKRREQPARQRNLSKPLVILRKLFISGSFRAGCASSERCGVLYLRKAYCCCNHTSNQTAVILCHSPTILQRLSTAAWEDRGWDCLKLNRFYLFSLFFFF